MPSVPETYQLCVFVCVASCYPDIWQENILLESSEKSGGAIAPLPPYSAALAWKYTKFSRKIAIIM